VKAGRGFLALLAVLTAGALGAPLAHAGSYDVLSCTVLLPGPHRFVPARTRRCGSPPPSNTAITKYMFVTHRYGWLTVETTRTRKGGACSTRYRFKSAGGRFRVRMRPLPNDSHPYARGTSDTRRVSVA
jgi:hypothetical protein